MADDAIVHLAQGFARGHAQIGQAEAVAVSLLVRGAFEERGELRIVEIARDQVVKIKLLRMHERGELPAALLQLG